jgi:hypothetical protein
MRTTLIESLLLFLAITFKYDKEPLLIHIVEERHSFVDLLVNVAGIIGGIFTLSGLVHQLAFSFWHSLSPHTLHQDVVVPLLSVHQ